MNTIPDIKIYSPCCYRSLCADINNAFYADEYTVAVRYPRGKPNDNASKLKFNEIEYGTYGTSDAKTVIVTYGRITSEAIDAVDELKEKGIETGLISLNQIKPLPENLTKKLKDKKKIFFFEEGQKSGGVAQMLAMALLEEGYKGKYYVTAIENRFVEQASVADLLHSYKLDKQSMIEKVSGETVG